MLPATFTVFSTGDDAFGGTIPGSLRQALASANANPGPDTIRFEIRNQSGVIIPGPHTIRLVEALPAITGPVTIDGFTQPTGQPPGQPRIELDGTNVTGPALQINSGNSTIRGLAINRFGQGDGIVLTGGGNVIARNYIGTNVVGTAALGNQNGVVVMSANNTIDGNVISGNRLSGIQISGAAATRNRVRGNYVGLNANGNAGLRNLFDGVLIDNGASSNTIGGANSSARNVISANGTIVTGNANDGGIGVAIRQGDNLNVVQGNFIGTDATGTLCLGNVQGGVFINGNSNTIGGAAAGAGNVISANGVAGMTVNGGAGNRILGNRIGTDVTGTFGLGNGEAGIVGFGISIRTGATNTVIGGTGPGEANIIAFNLRGGIRVGLDRSDPVTGTAIRGNSLFANGPIGIDLATDGVTTNDLVDADTGPNGLQNAPVITSGVATAAGTTIAGTLNSTPGTTFQIDLYSSPVALASPSGFGEGQAFLGSIQVTADDDGDASFSLTTPVVVFGSQVIAATATDPGGNTSEFSRSLAVEGPPQNAVTDVTGRVRVARRGVYRAFGTGRYLQLVTITNTSAGAIAGPISLVLDDLSPFVVLANRTGFTNAIAPAGRPYIDLDVMGLDPGQSAVIVLEFENPTNRGITYGTRVLAGIGPR